jgi:pilus assembly protein CpaE
MTEPRQASDPMEVALLTVNIDKETVDTLRSIAAQMPWTLIQADFDHYFSVDRRPYFNQKAIDAAACLAIVDFDKDTKLALETVEFLRNSFYQKTAIVAYSSSTDPDLLLKSMRAGCSEFLNKPLNISAFTDTVTRLNHRWSAIIAHPLDGGKILSFFGAKGGVGTTSLAVHLAVFLARDFKQKVLLIDNHTQLGHVALYLGIDGAHHTFHELVLSVSRLDSELLKGYVATHSSNLDILSSPDVYGGERNTDSEAVEQTVEFLSSQYDFVLLDCEATFEDTNLAVIGQSHWIYLIATPEIGAIRDLSRYVDGLIQNEQATDKLQVLINRYSARGAISTEQIEKAIRLPIAFKMSNDYLALLNAINTGNPILSTAKSDYAKEISRWASNLAGSRASVGKPPAKKFFAFF